MIVTETIYLNVAGFNIKINLYKTEWLFIKKYFKENILNYYRGFILKEKPKKNDYIIDIFHKKSSMTLFKKEVNGYFIDFYKQINDKKIITYYQISLIQFQIILRKILEKLLVDNRGFMLHASAVYIKERVYIFLGKPNAGKSTAMTLLSNKYPSLADDSAIIKKENNIYYLYQTPFIETNNWIRRDAARYRIGNLFFLKKSQFAKVIKITDESRIISQVIKQLWTEKNYLNKQIKYILDFISNYDFYYLYFPKDKEKLLELFNAVQK